MPEDEDFAFAGPSPQDVANGTAILASALVREAEALANAAMAMRAATQGMAEGAASDMVRSNAWQAVTLAGALTLVARLLLDCTGDVAHAAHLATEGLPREGIQARALVGHLRAAALAPVTDDGAARIAASIVAESFAAEFEAAWRRAPGGQGN